MLIPRWSRVLSVGIAALAMEFALGLQAAAPGVSVSETIRPVDPWPLVGSQIAHSRGLRVASLETEAVFKSATEDRDRQSESARFTRGRASSAEDPAIDSRVASFDERFAGAADWSSRQAAETEEHPTSILPSPDPGRHAVAPRAVGQIAPGFTPLPPKPPASVSKKPLRTAEAPQDSSSPPDAGGHTAIYDISTHSVYLPNGQRLEAHSGLGSRLDDPRYVSEKDRGPTPPNVYDLSLREELFHGVRAIRLIPIGGGNMFGRDGLLAHSYMLGPNGQSNGCVSLSDYRTFLNAFLSGEINRLVVVEHLGTTRTETAWGWLPEAIKAIFGRS